MLGGRMKACMVVELVQCVVLGEVLSAQSVVLGRVLLVSGVVLGAALLVQQGQQEQQQGHGGVPREGWCHQQMLAVRPLQQEAQLAPE